MDNKGLVVAVDGPAASGKSTIAKLVAKKLGLTYIDTGAMYRAFTYAVIKAGLNPESLEDAEKLIPGMKIDLLPDGRIICNDEDVTKVIRTPLVSGNVSYIAAMKPVRLALIKMQQEMGKKGSVIMDGRDIGTYVLPHADVKIFQVASVECRAKRRYDENVSKGIPTSYEDVKKEVEMRDYIDSHREFDPLMPAEDSIYLDTSELTIPEVVDAILKIIEEKTGVKPEC